MSISSPRMISAAALLILATAPTLVNAHTRDGASKVDLSAKFVAHDTFGAVVPKGLSVQIGTSRANDPHDLPCTADEIFVIYEEDKNGNPVPGTEQYGGTDP